MKIVFLDFLKKLLQNIYETAQKHSYPELFMRFILDVFEAINPAAAL